jgi:hypothetical protein
MPLFEMSGKILTPSEGHTAVKTLRRNEVKNVRVRDQIFASVGLHGLVEKALESEVMPIGVMKHLLRTVELLDMLRQAMFGRVDLATEIAHNHGSCSDITIFCCEITISEQHG